MFLIDPSPRGTQTLPSASLRSPRPAASAVVALALVGALAAGAPASLLGRRLASSDALGSAPLAHRATAAPAGSSASGAVARHRLRGRREEDATYDDDDDDDDDWEEGFLLADATHGGDEDDDEAAEQDLMDEEVEEVKEEEGGGEEEEGDELDEEGEAAVEDAKNPIDDEDVNGELVATAETEEELMKDIADTVSEIDDAFLETLEEAGTVKEELEHIEDEIDKLEVLDDDAAELREGVLKDLEEELVEVAIVEEIDAIDEKIAEEIGAIELRDQDDDDDWEEDARGQVLSDLAQELTEDRVKAAAGDEGALDLYHELEGVEQEIAELDEADQGTGNSGDDDDFQIEDGDSYRSSEAIKEDIQEIAQEITDLEAADDDGRLAEQKAASIEILKDIEEAEEEELEEEEEIEVKLAEVHPDAFVDGESKSWVKWRHWIRSEGHKGVAKYEVWWVFPLLLLLPALVAAHRCASGRGGDPRRSSRDDSISDEDIQLVSRSAVF